MNTAETQPLNTAGETIRVGDNGIRLPKSGTATLDVLFDGQRIWSFSPRRDGHRVVGQRGVGQRNAGHLNVDWPPTLRPFLDGRCDVVLREHVSERVLFEETVRFGSGQGPVRVVDKRGDALAVDKTGRLVRMFSDSAGANVGQLLDETERLLAVLHEEGGVPSYLCYGGLLGAVRTGHMIGHDCDIDLSYLSSHTQPADIILESYRLERLVRRHGWSTRRMSGDDFKVSAAMDDGTSIGMDVFGSFFVDGVFHLLPETRGVLPHRAIVPLSTVELEGRKVAAPADPEALLAVTYGASWRVPDPAFKFATPESTRRRLTGWMRGERANLRFWDRSHAGPDAVDVPDGPSPFAAWVAEQLPERSHVVDIGAGAGRDAVLFAQQGHQVVGYDYSGGALRQARQHALAEEASVRFERLNLYETREVLTHAGLRSHEGSTEAVYARLLLDGLRDDGRSNLWTYAKMVLRGGGRLFLEFRTPASRLVVAEIEAAGGVIEQRDVAHGRGGPSQDDPAVFRLVVRWS